MSAPLMEADAPAGSGGPAVPDPANARLAFVAETSRLLAASLDLETTLATVAGLALPHFGSWCMVDVVEPDGTIRRVAVIHPDAEKQRLARAYYAAHPPQPDDVLGAPRVIGTDTPELVEAAEVLKRIAHAELCTLLEALGADSVLTVPMTARGRTQGAVTFVCDGCRRYDAADLLLAEDLGRRCGMAVDNATLYAQAREAARVAIEARNATMRTARRAEDLLDEANLARHEAECAHEAKATFLGTVSHEFRTPLTAVQGFADLLADEASGPMNEAQRHQVERIRTASDHLLGLIDEILHFATQQAGRSALRLREVDVGEIVCDAACMIEPLAAAKGIGFTVDVPLGHVLFRTDAGKFRHMVLNLAANAVKYTDVGAVRVTLESARGALLLRVADTGIGIAPEQREQAFTPFWQADSSGGRGGGMGLGLAVTRQLAGLMEGELTVEAGTGGGSVFSLRLPVLPAETPAQIAAEGSDEAEQEHRHQGRRGITRRGAHASGDEENG